MKITFIHPNMFSRRAADAMEPLVFTILSSLTPKEVELELFDERVEEIDFDTPTDLVAMTVQTFTAGRSYKIAARFRERGIPVVMGGFHPTLVTEEALSYADSVAVGDSETTWPQIVEDAAAGKLKQIYRADPNHPLTGIRPDRGILGKRKYADMVPVQFGRGCRFSCDFCSIHSFYGSVARTRPLEDVVEEIAGLNSRFILFVDDNLFLNYEKAVELFRALIPLKIKWACQLSLDAAYNPQLLELLRESGCIAVFVGFESLNESNLRQMRKASNLANMDYEDGVNRFKSHGLMVCGSFVFGYDYDGPETVDRALDFSIRSKLCMAHFNCLFPTPGTSLYRRLQEEDRLIDDPWWLSGNFNYGQSFFHPRGMTAETLERKCFDARLKFNSLNCIARRCVDFKANSRNLFNMGSFLAANLVSRKEILMRRNCKLG